MLQVDDLAATITALREAEAHCRSEPISGPGDRQVVIDDPAGNAIELFQPRGAGGSKG